MLWILLCCDLVCIFMSRGINFVLSALVFNVFPTLLEVSMVSGVLVSSGG